MEMPLKRGLICAACLGFPFAIVAGHLPAQTAAPGATTAWRAGSFHVDAAGVLARSAVVLGRPNLDAAEAMPLGNGSLGVAVWSADGLTAQLNRNDTLPDRLSPGQVVIPGLAAVTGAKNYAGRLDLYNGEFQERGGGMTVRAFVEPDTDVLVVEVTGANPDQAQTAILRLWAPRAPHASIGGRMGMLSESWVDNTRPESSGRAFGSLSALTAEGRDVSAAVTDPLTVTLTFRPFPDGHFRISAAAPHFDGRGDAQTIAARQVVLQPDSFHKNRWQAFWRHAAPIEITSKDGAGEYMENLRAIYLFVAAIEKGVEFPGSQAGVADMISAARDTHKWDPSAFWHWNLRMQVAANLGAGLPELNSTYFNLYRENLTGIEQWTQAHMKGLPGSCVPETMRFNGRGIEYEAAWTPVAVGLNCDARFKPYYNARTLTTGAEVGLWIWRQYLATGDRAFLERNYPVMASAARFLRAAQNPGRDGLLHTGPSNAHETQWDVTDPTTDIAAILALYPAVIEAATLLDRDADLVDKLKAGLKRVPPFPRTAQAGPPALAPATSDGSDVIAESWKPGDEDHNIENIGLEPVWPYGLIGDDSPLSALAQRTYLHRLHPNAVDWSSDPIQAARLGLGSEVGSTLIATTEKFQNFPNGMARWTDAGEEFYVEQSGVVADALQEALVQDYDGLIRIAPAVPPAWDFDGCVAVQGKTRVCVQTRNGAAATVAIEAGTAQPLKLRNPWPGQRVDVVLGTTGRKVVKGAIGPVIEFPGIAGGRYLVEAQGRSVERLRFAAVGGTPASVAKKLGSVQIGISSSVP
jgi:hypothetical protein